MRIDVAGLVFDDENEAKFAGHRITLTEVQEVFDNAPRFYVNRPDRRASHVMLGPTFEDRVLLVPIEAWPNDLWRPVTAFEPSPQQEGVYRRRR